MKLFLLTLSVWAAQVVDPVRNFSVDYDASNWILIGEDKKNEVAPGQIAPKRDPSKEQTLFILQHRVVTDRFSPRLTMVEEKDVSDITQYENRAVKFLKDQRFTIQSQETRRFPNLSEPVVEIIAHQRDFGLKFVQWAFVKNKKGYLVTGASRIKSFDSFRPEAEKIFASLLLESQ